MLNGRFRGNPLCRRIIFFHYFTLSFLKFALRLGKHYVLAFKTTFQLFLISLVVLMLRNVFSFYFFGHLTLVSCVSLFLRSNRVNQRNVAFKEHT